MSEAFLQVLLENLNLLIKSELGLLLSVNKELKKLLSTLSVIQAVLEDAEQKQLHNKAVKDWLKKLKAASYAVDDILDDCKTEAFELQIRDQGFGSRQRLSTSLFPIQNIVFRRKLGKKIKDIRESMDAIADDRIKFHLRKGVVGNQDEYVGSRETGSLLTQPQLYGREEAKEKIVKVLVEEVCDREDISVQPIVGMGGLGKTTLAQMIFNDKRVKNHFEPRIWVYVSEELDIKRVMKSIIVSSSGKHCENPCLDSLQRSLQNDLNGKRYLIVLDDVWNDDQEKWSSLKHLLACGSKGASIIVTSRHQKVASIMGSTETHNLSFLSDDECWLLFRQRAFGNGNEERADLVAIGREIVKKCGGVPLAAKALGGLMRFKHDENQWAYVQKSEIWNLSEDENPILPSLRLSYYNLPLELKRCFAYCAIFPKGSKIEKETLIHLWMAIGCITFSEDFEPEVRGEEVWDKLYWRSLFQDIEKDEFGRVRFFKMHDLVHDLARSAMEDECEIREVGCSTDAHIQNVRHLTILVDGNSFPKSHGITDITSLRTLRLQGSGSITSYETPDFECDFSRLPSLRVLDAGSARMEKISPSIGRLKRLRYLDLSHARIKQLPDSICCLSNLQTLILEHSDVRSLPKNMKYMKNLRHLYLPHNPLFEMPPQIGKLTSLKKLNLFVVGTSKDQQLAEMKSLNLGGKLRIEHLERVKDPMDARETNLVGKKNLNWLELTWDSFNCEPPKNVEEVCAALQPHPNSLKKLVIDHYRGAYFPEWMNDCSTLENIVEIDLKNCQNCSSLPCLGRLRFLRKLEIGGMDNLEYIDDKKFIPGEKLEGDRVECIFKSLERLSIYDLPNLQSFSREVEGAMIMPRLGSLSISGCPKLNLTSLSSLKHLTVLSGCSSGLLNSIANITGLTSLIVRGNDEITSFPEKVLGNQTPLRSLALENFPKLRDLPKDFASLSALKVLYITECSELEYLPEEGLRGLESLQSLKIANCPKLRSLSSVIRFLTTLESLIIRGCPKLEAVQGFEHLSSLKSLYLSGPVWSNNFDAYAEIAVLPEGLQDIPSLQRLTISQYPDMTTLPEWLGNLSSLQSLSILACPKLASLPESIRILTKLKRLSFTYCALELGRRCQKEKGEDWYKIAHIPEINICAPRTTTQGAQGVSNPQFNRRVLI